MRFVRRFWYLIAVFGLLLAATFLIQATKGNIVSNFFIEWVSVWSTFVGAIAALLIVIVVVTTYWQERTTSLLAAESKVHDWVLKLFTISTELILAGDEEAIITEQQRKNILDIILESTKNGPEIRRLAARYAPEILGAVREVDMAFALIVPELLKSPVKVGKITQVYDSLWDEYEEILRSRFI